MTTARFTQLFILCGSVAEVRAFYCDLLGMPCEYYSDGEYLDLDAGGMKIMFFESGQPLPRSAEWAWQPGWSGGTDPRASFALRIEEQSFPQLVEQIRAQDIPRKSDFPEWRAYGYWGYVLKDPAGNTLELYTEPERLPEVTVWPGSE